MVYLQKNFLQCLVLKAFIDFAKQTQEGLMGIRINMYTMRI